MNDQFYQIEGLPDYFISKNGVIKRQAHSIKGKDSKTYYRKEIIRKCYIASVGYLSIEIRRKHFRLHRLLAQTFIPNPENKRTVNHIDGNKLNNSLSNLEWATDSENNKHAYDIGLKIGAFKGKSSPPSKPLKVVFPDGSSKAFESINKASKAINIHSIVISKCMKANRPHRYTKMKFIYGV